MQEDLENRSVVLTTKTAKMTANVLAKLMRAALRKMKESRGKPVEGKQSLKQLSKGGELSNVEIKDENIKAFDPIARKYNISYALKRDSSLEPPRWLVFFKAKDESAMTAAFKEFTAKMVKRDKDRPSARGAMQKFRDVIKNAFRDKTRNKQREVPDR